MSEKLHIEGQEIAIKRVNEEDYISLTDIAKQNRPEQAPNEVVRNWLGNQSTLLFIEEWELNFNADFKHAGFRMIEKESMKNSPNITPKFLKEAANIVGVYSVQGRYGGIYAHVDLAFEFAMWIEPRFKVKLIRDYKRLRSEEAQRKRIEWNAGRELARLGYPVMSEAVRLKVGADQDSKESGAYANEANLINELIFGMTAKQWRAKNPDAKGNIRDTASTVDNALIAMCQTLNAYLMKNGARHEARKQQLAKMIDFARPILDKKYLPE